MISSDTYSSNTNKELSKHYQCLLLTKREHVKQLSLEIHTGWKQRDAFKLNLHYFSAVEVREGTARTAWLDSVLARACWLIHPEPCNITMYTLCTRACATGSSSSKTNTSNRSPVQKQGETQKKSLQNGNTYSRQHLLMALATHVFL